ncbi:hypothetical protein BDP81DRAFT_430304 [Colletotrichum phormii]|uniref:Uncharacterized protein n=1 Tax=Colletotrichum phormii TaxID=359342 RepID=A0AAI9ZPI8_9PEZI|nr:uncharacterized protein BDP81DRAFT_430304 [Colletotrichum phormii]KAK1635795.1 hypothetical protein BDP81DRAFT_430304 [Colletotrichum phormii]
MQRVYLFPSNLSDALAISQNPPSLLQLDPPLTKSGPPKTSLSETSSTRKKNVSPPPPSPREDLDQRQTLTIALTQIPGASSHGAKSASQQSGENGEMIGLLRKRRAGTTSPCSRECSALSAAP